MYLSPAGDPGERGGVKIEPSLPSSRREEKWLNWLKLKRRGARSEQMWSGEVIWKRCAPANICVREKRGGLAPQVASVASTSFLQMGSSKRGAAEELDEAPRVKEAPAFLPAVGGGEGAG